MRIVVDTGVLISAALFESSVPREALTYVLALHTPVVSSELTHEYRRVMASDKFDSYTQPRERLILLETYIDGAEHIKISWTLRVCRDPRDDMVIETALEGNADILVTGDADILALRPMKGISIMTPSEFVAIVRYQQGDGWTAHVMEKYGNLRAPKQKKKRRSQSK